jgi:hypothetical protein
MHWRFGRWSDDLEYGVVNVISKKASMADLNLKNPARKKVRLCILYVEEF